ncbi:TonB-dependent receptor [Compostibacter hankyongensis]|uniref:TonB-dependent receptor n=2 Tax=Compostibacter hankyongensis TaxID=1007089 RepID=A0ABP8FUJ2_9BACT
MVVLLPLLVCGGMVHAQQSQVTVTGKVVDARSHQPLPGVSVWNPKTNKGLGVTDAAGNYSISIPAGTNIQFRFVGYRSKTVKAASGRVNISLELGDRSLKEAVIVGYQRKTKETLTGAVSVIGHDQIQDAPVANVQDLLQGKVAGLNIQNNTGAPGFRGTVSIRGISQLSISGNGDQSYLATNNPLLVIDNVPVDYDGGFSQDMLQPGAATGPLALIPPEDIETIEVLKDAQATSLYGSRGANGVIIITTRKGNSPTPIIDVNSSVFVNFPPQLRPTWGGNLERWYRVNSILNYSKDLQTARNMLAADGAQFLTDSLNPFYNNATDWQGLFYQTTINTNNNVQISGGNPKLNYKANLSYQLNQGVIKNTGFNKYSLNMQLNMQPMQNLRISTQLFGALGQKQRGNGGGLTGNGAGDAFTSSLLPGPAHFVGIPQFEGYENNMDDNNTVNIRAFVDLDYEFIPNFRINSTTSYDYYTDTRDRFNQAFANNNQTQLYGFVGRRDELNSRNGINYNFNSDKTNAEGGHNVYASLFTEINVKTDNQHIRDVRNGPSDYYWGPRGYSPRFYPGNPWNDAAGINDNGTSVSNLYHALSWAASLSYNYKTKYNIDLAYRLDGNSAAGVNNRYTVNPSIGFRWNFNKEHWMSQFNWLDFGSFRLTYGQNSRATATLVNSLGSFKTSTSYNNIPAIIPNPDILPNPFLQPEKSYQYNFGVDLGLFKSRLEIIYDTYFKKTFNIVRDLYLPNVTGFNKIQLNGASIANFGHELTITGRPIVSPDPKGFQWTINVNGAYNRGVLTHLPGDLQFYRQEQGAPTYQEFALQVGNNVIANYIYKTLGIFQSTDDVPVDPVRGVRYKAFRGNGTNQYFQAGDVNWLDINGDYALDDRDDNIPTGRPAEPLVTGGISNTFNYRNFSLNVYCSYVLDRSILNNALAGRMRRMQSPDQLKITGTAEGPVNVYDLSLIDYWKPGSVNAKYPALEQYYHSLGPINYRLDQTLFQEDGSYFKINQITLSYNFRDFGFMKRWGMRLLRTYVTAYNIGIFSPYSGPNPETVTDLGRDDISGYPSAASFTIGLSTEF